MSEKPKLSMYWASSCGGCEIALANINEKILAVNEAFDFFFCPCLLDTKKKDIEELPNRGIAVTLFNGAIRNEENEEMARLMRKKSKLQIAFGSTGENDKFIKIIKEVIEEIGILESLHRKKIRED